MSRLKTKKTPAGKTVLAQGRGILRIESAALAQLADNLDASFAVAVRVLGACAGRIVVTGVGKPGHIAQKISATLASTGAPSFYLHPTEARHGDLGRLKRGDVVLALSNSGETEELTGLLTPLKKMGVKIVAVTGNPKSALARQSTVHLFLGNIDEVCPLGLAPTASTTAMLALGDALAVTLMKSRKFTRAQYAKLHPGGSLGRKLKKVSEIMRQGKNNPLIHEQKSIAEAVGVMTHTPGRPGATSVIDRKGRLVGIFTDGDLRRKIEEGFTDFKKPISSVMTRNPKTLRAGQPLPEAIQVVRRLRVDQLPVIDGSGKLVGLLDVQDIVEARAWADRDAAG